MRLNNLDIDKWHLNGTFYCRNYKILALDIINNLKPKLYIDIGCGLGEILSKVKLNKSHKIGYDKDISIKKAIEKLHPNKFLFFEKYSAISDYIKSSDISKEDLKVISMLNFVHNINLEELEEMVNNFHNEFGEYILLIDNIFDKSKEYKFNHHEFLFNHDGLIKYFYKVDKLRSLYCIKIK